jgi:dinuclear metal center YbgI/SA1388 family protein
MYPVHQLLSEMNRWAPFTTKMDYDNVGLLVGDPEASFSSVLVALDLTEDVVDEAIEKQLNVILTHHPLIFRSLKQIHTNNEQGRILQKLLKHDIQHIASHTNLDKAQEGVSFALAEQLGLSNLSILAPEEDLSQQVGQAVGLGVLGELPNPTSTTDFLERVSTRLGTAAIRYAGSRTKPLRRIAVCGGTAVSLLPAALKQQADAYVTADIKYHEYFVEQKDFLLVDAGHFETEQIIIQRMIDKLMPAFPQAQWISTAIHTNPMKVYVAKSQDFHKKPKT